MQESLAMFRQSGFPKGHWLGMWHPWLGVRNCVWTVRLSCVNLQCWGSVERVAGEFVILTTLAPGEGPLLQQRTLWFPVSVEWKDLLHKGAWNFSVPKTLPVWIHEPWGYQQHLSLHGKWCSSPAVYPHDLYECWRDAWIPESGGNSASRVLEIQSLLLLLCNCIDCEPGVGLLQVWRQHHPGTAQWPSLAHHIPHRDAYGESGPGTNFGHELGHDRGDSLGLVLLQPEAMIKMQK